MRFCRLCEFRNMTAAKIVPMRTEGYRPISKLLQSSHISQDFNCETPRARSDFVAQSIFDVGISFRRHQ